MRLYDMYTEQEYTLPEMFNDWNTFRKEEPWNHAENFTTEIYEVLMATVNGRNDCTVSGMTAKEVDRYIQRLRKEIEKHDYR